MGVGRALFFATVTLAGGGGGRDLGGGNCTGENEGDNECANDGLHGFILLISVILDL